MGVLGVLAVVLPLVLVVGVGIALIAVTMGAGEESATVGGVLHPAPAAAPLGAPREAYHPIGPVRLLAPTPGEELVGGRPIVLGVVGDGLVPPTSRARTALVHLTAVEPPGPLEVAFRPPGAQDEHASVRFDHGTTTRGAVVELGQGGAIELTPDRAVTELAVDLVGWWGDGTAGAGRRFREAPGGAVIDAELTDGQAVQGRLTTAEGKPVPSSAVALVEVTVTSDAPGTMSLWPATTEPPAVPTLSYGPGMPHSLRTLLPVGPDAAFTVVGSGAHARCRIDLVGWLDDGEPKASGVDGALSPTVLQTLAAA